MGHPVVHFQIGAKNDLAAAAFYSQLFGWTATAVEGMPYHMIQTGSPLGIQGGIAKAEAEAEAVVAFYVEVPDVAAALAQAVALGATVTQPATAVMPTLTLGMFLDLEGRAVGLSHDSTPRPAPAVLAAPPVAVKKAKKKAKPKPAKKAKPAKKTKKAAKKKKK